VKNPVSWIDFANVVYLEQPAGVGFSYSNNSAGYNTGDTQSTIDNYAFVQAFLQAYPKFVGRPTYLTGECETRFLVMTFVFLTWIQLTEESTFRLLPRRFSAILRRRFTSSSQASWWEIP
jgi:hypothetical protein